MIYAFHFRKSFSPAHSTLLSLDPDPLQLKRTGYKPVNGYDLLKEIQGLKVATY